MKTFDDESLGTLRDLLSSRAAEGLEPGDLRAAAVLLCLVETGTGWNLVLSKRSDDLPVHSGQVSFPGGALEDGETPEEAAVREAEEEVGIPSSTVELVGRLDDIMTRTGFLVSTLVGVAPRPERYRLQPGEVVDLYEVPLTSLLRPENPEIRTIAWKGITYPVYVYHHDSIEIWGVTGRILKAFLDVVRLTV